MRFALILSLLIAILAVVFAIYNQGTVQLQVPGYALTAPLAVVIIVTLLAGVLTGILASVPSIMRRGREVRQLRKSLNEQGRSAPATTPTTTREKAPRPAEPPADADAAETQRLAAETQRMAADAQRRASEMERREGDAK